jgi:rRNA maturation endonuclease Nob1
VESKAEETQDIENLSEIDIQVIAIALDYQNSTVISDDNGVQNVCAHLEIPIKPYSFKIRKTREYFWKCTVCGEKYKRKQGICIECGSPTKRLFLSKKSK